MRQGFVLHQNKRKSASYRRRDLIGDVLYNSFFHREFQMNFAKKGKKNTTLTDDVASFLLEKGLITREELGGYYDHIASLFTLQTIGNFDAYSVESLYEYLLSEREKFLGKEVLVKARLLAAEESENLSFCDTLDQRELILKTCAEKGTVLVALTEAELFATAKEVLKPLEETGKRLFFIASETGETGLFSVAEYRALFQREISFVHLEKGKLLFEKKDGSEINLSDTALLVFGESGLLDCRNLLIPSGVYAIPRGYFASAVACQLGILRPAAVYIPEGFSIVESVPVTAPTRLSYLILSKLAKRFGEQVYDLSYEELCGRYPQFFFNVYEASPEDFSQDTIPSFSPERKRSRSYSELQEEREKAIAEHLEAFPNCKYYTRTFSEKETPGIQGKILVHGVKVNNCADAKVVPCGKNLPLRAKMREMQREGTALVSNFLFFLTPKLATLYNNLRHDRREEQAEVDAGHLDYLLEYRHGKRKETFPLFRKTCIAMKDDGQVLFFNFRLGGGRIAFRGIEFFWKKEDVDPIFQKDLPPVCVFTPYLSLPDGDADRETYRKAVGEDRWNLVIIQDRITAVRRGDVILPGMGVVISLSEELGKTFCEKLNLKPMENGYFSPEDISFTVTLDAPEEIEKAEWKKVKWAYGGGLSLILDGVGLCDGDHMEAWFERDGWTSPLSRQTQESGLHSLAKHPRTAVGTTAKGELVILVFSGRTSLSDGADYREMCLIARELIPDIKYLMNVDGGGSAVLGMVYNGSFTELSLPSTSTGSTVGMVRPINTTLYIPIKKEKEE